MALEYVNSEKGKPKLVDSGHLFIRDRSTETKVLWKCDKSRKQTCRARLHTEGDNIIHRIGDHNHAADIAAVQASRVVNAVKDRAASTQESGHQIVTQAFANTSVSVAGKLPSQNCLKRTLRRVRKVDGLSLPNPASLQQLQIAPELTLLKNGEDFLKFDSGAGAKRMLIFGTASNFFRNLHIGTETDLSEHAQICLNSYTQFTLSATIVCIQRYSDYFLASPKKHTTVFNRL